MHDFSIRFALRKSSNQVKWKQSLISALSWTNLDNIQVIP